MTDQVLSIYTGTHGYLDKVPLSEVHAWEEGFLEVHSRKRRSPLWQKITDTKQLDDASAAEIDQAIAEFQGRYVGEEGDGDGVTIDFFLVPDFCLLLSFRRGTLCVSGVVYRGTFVASYTRRHF